VQRAISSESPYAPKFVLMGAEFLQKASRLPPEFASQYANWALDLSVNAVRSSYPVDPPQGAIELC
jgi:hypothetical protein